MPYGTSDDIADLTAQVKALTAARDAARANARILAHSYTHDSRPPQRAVDEALAYPADPRANKREKHGRVIAWNPGTWWGTIEIGRPQPVEFHGTSVRGMSRTGRWPRTGDAVTVIFSDDKCKTLLSVEHRQTPGMRDGVILSFDRNTLTGRVGFCDGAPVSFHSTSAGGHVYSLRWPAVGDPVTVTFTDDKCETLLSVEHRSVS